MNTDLFMNDANSIRSFAFNSVGMYLDPFRVIPCFSVANISVLFRGL